MVTGTSRRRSKPGIAGGSGHGVRQYGKASHRAPAGQVEEAMVIVYLIHRVEAFRGAVKPVGPMANCNML